MGGKFAGFAIPIPGGNFRPLGTHSFLEGGANPSKAPEPPSRVIAVSPVNRPQIHPASQKVPEAPCRHPSDHTFRVAGNPPIIGFASVEEFCPFSPHLLEII
jgi:hypothetical protein